MNIIYDVEEFLRHVLEEVETMSYQSFASQQPLWMAELEWKALCLIYEDDEVVNSMVIDYDDLRECVMENGNVHTKTIRSLSPTIEQLRQYVQERARRVVPLWWRIERENMAVEAQVQWEQQGTFEDLEPHLIVD